MAIEDDDKPRKKIAHEIGQDLSLLSVEEFSERIALMTSEIERLQAAHEPKSELRRTRPTVSSNRSWLDREIPLHSVIGRYGKQSLKKIVRLRLD